MMSEEGSSLDVFDRLQASQESTGDQYIKNMGATEIQMFESSLNVELVYIILKSIMGFSYISYKERTLEGLVGGRDKILEGVDLDKEDTCIKLNNLKLENFNLWEERIQNNEIGVGMSRDDLELNL